MSYIHVKLLGNFSATFNGKNISFPYSKVQALFCYILTKKQTTREELSGLLWPDMEENIARKNLRNALYKLKKSFGEEEVLAFSNKSTIALNTTINIETDIDKFINGDNEIDVYKGEFLKGYMPKDAENFQSWMFETRAYLEGIYLKRLNEQIELEKNNKNYDKIEQYCKLLIKADEFNEEAYRNLIFCYKEQGKLNNAIKAYNQLADKLNQELSINPEDETTRVFKEVLDLMNERSYQKEKSADYFYGRLNELRLMENNYQNFIKNKNAKSILIKGEMGIGKTKLKDKFIQLVERDKVYVLETNCYQFENEYVLKPWRNIISSLARIISEDKIKIPALLENIIGGLAPETSRESYLSNIKLEETIDLLKYDVVGNIITDILKRISMKKKVLLVFEDIQWMDSVSMSLLTSFISHCEENNMIFLLTCRNEFNPHIDRFFASTRKYDKIQTIELIRFNTSEAEGFINKALPGYSVSKEMMNKIYTETEGNTFFLTEYLNIIKLKKNINIMTSKMQDVLKSKFLDISEEERKIVEIASFFHDEVPMFILKELTQKDELQIMDIIEQLEHKFILKEITKERDVCFKFTHQKLREFEYMNLSQAKKKILHNRIGQLIEKTLRNNVRDINVYYKLIYHFENANNTMANIKYRIKSLNVYLNFSHELFPIIYNNDNCYDKLYFSDSKTTKSLTELESLLNKLKDEDGDSIEVLKLEVCVLHIKGRYLIRKGEYEEGIKNIQDMIYKANEIKYTEYAIEGYKQMAYYCIQTNKTDDMITYINCGLDLAEECSCQKEIGILLRLKALYKKMLGKYAEAEALMLESINTLSGIKNISDQYILNIAACYNYIGDIRSKTGKFLEALQYYNKAIQVCEEKNVLTSIALFNTNAGEAAYCINDYDLAKKYFQKALNIYRQFDFIWGRSIAEAFMSLISIKEENFEDALKFLKNADVNSKLLKNPKEIGTVFRVKAEIKLKMKTNQIFEKYLNEDFEEYFKQGILYLKKARDEYQIDALNKLIV